MGLPAPLHPPALVRRPRRIPGRGQPHHVLAPPRRVHGRDLRRPRRRLEAGERDELLRGRRLRRAGLAAGPRRPARGGARSRGDPPRRRPRRPRCSAQTGAPVASIFALSCEVALDDDEATAKVVRSLRAVNWDAGIGPVPRRRAARPGPGTGGAPRPRRLLRPLRVLLLRDDGRGPGRVVRYPVDAPVSPLGYGIWADGLGLVLDRLHDELPGTPLLIDEYGIGTADDTQRAAYLEDGLRVVHEALDRGIGRPGFLPLDRGRQLRVAPRLRRAFRHHLRRPGASGPARRCSPARLAG